MENIKTKRGGKRSGAGRKPRYSARMTQKTVRLPPELIEKLISEYGSFQVAIESLVLEHFNHNHVE